MNNFIPTHRHLKSGGLYRVITRGHMEADYPATAVVVYGDAEGRVFVRAAAEFDDGRFELINDHSPDAGNMVPPADLVERVKAIIFEHVDVVEEYAGRTVTGLDDAARAVLALFAEREKAAAGLLEALEEVANPLAAMKRRAEENGQKLSGMAYQIANSVGHLQAIAIDAISAAKDAGIRGRHD